jgi:hypothetical protein
MTVRYNQSGYVGSSRSVRAVEAETEGKFPLTRAIQNLTKTLGITRKAARELLIKVGPCEAHHTSKYANLTDYYDLGEAAREFKLASDPLREEVEEAERCELYGYDGWRWLGDVCFGMEPIEKALNSPQAAYEIDIISDLRRAVIDFCHESQGSKIQRAKNFRRWEPALRRIAERIY